MTITSPITDRRPDFVRQLLAQQQELTAVEQFSGLHDAGQLTGSAGHPDQAPYYRQLLPASPPAAGQQYAFEVDLDACSGCKACVVACHTMNGLEDDEAWRRVGTVVHEDPFALPVMQHVTTACHHCEDPGCLSGCPVKAYEKDPVTGIVRHLDDQCIGCKYCTMMCPYEVPQYSERLGIVRKCDMCHQRLSVGEAPACVQSCPNQAIKIRVVDTSVAMDGGSVGSADERLAPGAPLSSITRPTTIYQSSASDFDASRPQDDAIDQVAENHWPLAVMLVATQVSVGMLLWERLLAAGMWVGGEEMSTALTRWNALIALLILGVGLNVAPLHLGRPLRAWRVFLGLRTSWLSREAIVLGKTMGVLSLAVGMLWLPAASEYIPESLSNRLSGWWSSGMFAEVLLWLALPLGMLGLHSSAMVYVATRRRLWRGTRTSIRFMGTAAVAGAAWTMVIVGATAESTLPGLALALVAAVGLAAKLLWEWNLHLGARESGDDYDRRSRRLVKRELRATAQRRIGLGAIGVLLLAVAGALLAWAPMLAVIIAVLAAVAISAGEFAERILFFSSVVYDRMPGTLR